MHKDYRTIKKVIALSVSALLAGVAAVNFGQVNAKEGFGTKAVIAEAKTVSVSMPDIYVGQGYPEPKIYVDGEAITSDYGYELWITDENDTEEYYNAPDKAGTYVVHVQIFDFDGSVMGETTSTFNVKRWPLSVSVPDINYGENVSPSLIGGILKDTGMSTGNALSLSNFNVQYRNTLQNAYTNNAPTEVGTYEIIVSDDSGVYESATATFSINKKKGAASVTLGDVYLGTKYEPTIISSDYTVTSAIIEYKKAQDSDSSYSKNKPQQAGSYYVRVTLPENAAYSTCQLTLPFTVKYMTAPKYEIEGTKVEDGLYSTNVKIVAPSGYKISASADKDFSSYVEITENSSIDRVYFMNQSTGALSDAVKLEAITVDTSKPEFANGTYGKTYYEDCYYLNVSDSNLVSVTVNGKKIPFSGELARIPLKSNNGIENYKIIATDKAGNKSTMEITVAAAWYKTGIIPEGQWVKLKAGVTYHLSEGSWLVNGDDTIYSGNIDFVVNEDGEYMFTKK